MEDFKVAFITLDDARLMRNWSGTVLTLLQNFEKRYKKVIVIDRIDKIYDPRMIILKIFNKIRKNDAFHRMPVFLKMINRQVEKKLKKLDVDFVFSPQSLLFAYLKTPHKKVFWTDATFHAMVDYYPEYTDLSPYFLKWGDYHEKVAIENVNLAFYSSKWAADSAINHYKAETSKVKMIQFGANTNSSVRYEDIDLIVEKRLKSGKISLLSIGVDWIRKGFELTISIADELYRSGYEVELNIVGVYPPLELKKDYTVIIHGKLDKTIPEQSEILTNLYLDSTFFVLPSKAECAAVVLAEASSFALPSVTRDTGGITSIVQDGSNGLVLSYNAKPSDYVQRIIDLIKDKRRYNEYCKSSFQQYLKELNWNSSFDRFTKIISDLFKP